MEKEEACERMEAENAQETDESGNETEEEVEEGSSEIVIERVRAKGPSLEELGLSNGGRKRKRDPEDEGPEALGSKESIENGGVKISLSKQDGGAPERKKKSPLVLKLEEKRKDIVRLMCEDKDLNDLIRQHFGENFHIAPIVELVEQIFPLGGMADFLLGMGQYNMLVDSMLKPIASGDWAVFNGANLAKILEEVLRLGHELYLSLKKEK